MGIKTDWKWDSERAEVKGIDAGGVRVLVANVKVWGKDPEQIEAHGRLIAAAPEMFAALEAITLMVDAFPHGKKRFDIDGGILKKVRAAIRKAEGE